MREFDLMGVKEADFHEASINHSVPTSLRVLGLQKIQDRDYPVLEFGFGISGRESIRYALLNTDDCQTTGWYEEKISVTTPFEKLTNQISTLHELKSYCSRWANQRIRVAPLSRYLTQAFERKIDIELDNNIISAYNPNQR